MSDNRVLEVCVECQEEIQPKEKTILVYEDIFDKWWVHDGTCSDRYRLLFTSSEEINKGVIMGSCYYCAKPIREKEQYVVNRNRGMVKGTTNKKEEDPLYTTVPLKENIWLAHKECAGKYIYIIKRYEKDKDS